jgi:hypothetical protein
MRDEPFGRTLGADLLDDYTTEDGSHAARPRPATGTPPSRPERLSWHVLVRKGSGGLGTNLGRVFEPQMNLPHTLTGMRHLACPLACP